MKPEEAALYGTIVGKLVRLAWEILLIATVWKVWLA